MKFNGKTIAIVGGTTGLGLSAAKAIVEAGGKVGICGRSEESLRSALTSLGPDNAMGISADASDSSTAPVLIDKLVSAFGHLGGLYHVAGGSGRSKGDGPIHELTDEGWEFTCALNLSSVIFSNRAAVRQFREQGSGGAILNVGSVLGFSPEPKHFASHGYAATKSAVIGFTKSIASFYAPENIRANVIAPALVETPMSERARNNQEIVDFMKAKQPLDGGRLGAPADLDEAVLMLLGDGGKYITGQTITVDGGWSVS